jgi:hypothetical protein
MQGRNPARMLGLVCAKLLQTEEGQRADEGEETLLPA